MINHSRETGQQDGPSRPSALYNGGMSFLLRALFVIGVIYWLSPLGGSSGVAELARPAGEKALTGATAWCRDNPAECAALARQGQDALVRGLKN